MPAAAPFPSEGRRPLGEVLVERGIVTREQLAAALEQQRSTGQHLGEIIVALGFAPGPIIAQALATQHGGLMKTEYGFATGWTRDDARAPTPAATQVDASALAERDRTIAALRDWAEKAQAAIDSRDAAIAQLRADDAAAHAELEAESARLASLRAQVEEQAAEIAQVSAARTTAEHELAVRENALEALRAERPALLEAHAAEVTRLEAALTELKDAHRANAELDRRLQNARSRADTLAVRVAEQEAELEALRAQPAAEPNRWASAASHYVLRRGPDGYELVAHDGPPPAVGDTVDGLRVARVAPAGPGFEVPCVHLAE